jgi:undecaprenyl-diphosphatase
VLTYFQAVIIGLFQGVTELFPISSLGHSVILPELFGWHGVVKAQSADESYYLAFLVALHVATALALLFHYRSTWGRIVGGFFSSIRTRRIETPDQRLAMLLIVATIPVGITGLAFEHLLRVVFAKPAAASIFLIMNGGVLFLGEHLRRRVAIQPDGREAPGRKIERLQVKDAAIIGLSQTAALFAGISRSGVTMVGGLYRGLNHEDAARFSFLLATPVILAAGLVKIPDLAGPLGNGIHGQAIAGALAAFVAAYFAVRFLERFFERRTLMPFAIYCLVIGVVSLVVAVG